MHAMVEGNVGTIVEVNSETDFVAKNADFQAFVSRIAKIILDSNPKDVESLLTLKFNDQFSVQEELREKILTIGENINIRRFERYEGHVVSYVHSGGRIGVLVLFNADEASAKNPEFMEVGKDIAMQVAALNPLYLNKEAVPAQVIDNEREILMAQIKNDPKMASKPDNIIAKMVDGRIGKYYENNCLVDQAFVKDGSITASQYVAQKAKEFGGKLEIARFVRYEKGEGIQKKEENLADEIAKIIK
ncbi:Elongation factor Ts [bioreactor metagenome]|uniref:Elongation factor Ts n=1 Tax=bioreactor metagenome TaxID=1076179 RepID=A0A645CGW2_9ZZZZ